MQKKIKNEQLPVRICFFIVKGALLGRLKQIQYNKE